MSILQLPPVLSKASERDKVWEDHHAVKDLVQSVFSGAPGMSQVRRGERMINCAPFLIFKIFTDPESRELVHKLRYAEFCRVRLCPTCMWRKSMAWRARFYQAWPCILSDHPKARYFHLVLTVPNCSIEDLRATIDRINKAWYRMISRKTWPALGFIKSIEVTRDKWGKSHPHLHALMMVDAGYFSGRNYMNRDDWRSYWLSALRIPLDSNCIHPFIRAVKGGADEVSKAVLEVSKYAVKMKAMTNVLRHKPGREWFLELDRQLYGTRAVSLGGILAKYLKSGDVTEEEMRRQDKVLFGELLGDIQYHWQPEERQYFRTKILSEVETLWWNRQEEKLKDNLRARVDSSDNIPLRGSRLDENRFLEHGV